MKLKITIWCEDESFDMDKDKEDMIEWAKNLIENEAGIEVFSVEIDISEFEGDKK